MGSGSKRTASKSPETSRATKRHASSSPEDGEVDDLPAARNGRARSRSRSRSPLAIKERQSSAATAGKPEPTKAKVPFPFKKKTVGGGGDSGSNSARGDSVGREKEVEKGKKASYERSKEDERLIAERDRERERERDRGGDRKRSGGAQSRTDTYIPAKTDDHWEPSASSSRDRDTRSHTSRHRDRPVDRNGRDYEDNSYQDRSRPRSTASGDSRDYPYNDRERETDRSRGRGRSSRSSHSTSLSPSSASPSVSRTRHRLPARPVSPSPTPLSYSPVPPRDSRRDRVYERDNREYRNSYNPRRGYRDDDPINNWAPRGRDSHAHYHREPLDDYNIDDNRFYRSGYASPRYDYRDYDRDYDRRRDDYRAYDGRGNGYVNDKWGSDHYVPQSPPRGPAALTSGLVSPPASRPTRSTPPPPSPVAPPPVQVPSVLPEKHAAVSIALPPKKPPPPAPADVHSPPSMALPPAPPPPKKEAGTTPKVMKEKEEQVVGRKRKREPVHRSREDELRVYGRMFAGCGKQEDYDVTTKLGEGTFGEVHKAVQTRTGTAVALKRILMHNEKEGMPVTALREIKILKALKHPNIVPLLDLFVVRSKGRESPLSVYMVFPYMDHDLAGLLENERVKLTVSQIKLYMKQLIEGTEYMHRNHILHRDMKAANLLISNTGSLKIADFGLARSFDPHSATMPEQSDDSYIKARRYTNCVVTRWYRPPELLLGARHYGGEIDMWGIGCVLGEMFVRHPILAGTSDLDQLEKIWQLCGTPTQISWPNFDLLPGCEGVKHHVQHPKTLLKVFDVYGQETYDLLDKLLTCNPRDRITASEALDHDYFWSDPLPADPKTLPTYEASHEYDKRGRRHQQHAEHQRMQQMQQQQQQQQHHHHHQAQQQQRQQIPSMNPNPPPPLTRGQPYELPPIHLGHGPGPPPNLYFGQPNGAPPPPAPMPSSYPPPMQATQMQPPPSLPPPPPQQQFYGQYPPGPPSQQPQYPQPPQPGYGDIPYAPPPGAYPPPQQYAPPIQQHYGQPQAPPYGVPPPPSGYGPGPSPPPGYPPVPPYQQQPPPQQAPPPPPPGYPNYYPPPPPQQQQSWGPPQGGYQQPPPQHHQQQQQQYWDRPSGLPPKPSVAIDGRSRGGGGGGGGGYDQHYHGGGGGGRDRRQGGSGGRGGGGGYRDGGGGGGGYYNGGGGGGGGALNYG